jgi:hypothetical protein
MTTSEEIEAALHRLPTKERWELLHRFSEELWAGWDRQIEEGLVSGRLDELIGEARAEVAIGKTRSLDDLLSNR